MITFSKSILSVQHRNEFIIALKQINYELKKKFCTNSGQVKYWKAHKFIKSSVEKNRYQLFMKKWIPQTQIDFECTPNINRRKTNLSENES
jgi:hypothetical protein